MVVCVCMFVCILVIDFTEISDLNEILDEDAKNHNAWQYRQWMVSHFSLPIESEYEMVEDLIIADCNNNSAWNYRYLSP